MKINVAEAIGDSDKDDPGSWSSNSGGSTFYAVQKIYTKLVRIAHQQQ